MEQFFQRADIGAIVPELELAVFGMFLLIFDLMVKTKRRLGYIALIGVAVWLSAIRLSGVGAAILSQAALFIARKIWLMIRARGAK